MIAQFFRRNLPGLLLCILALTAPAGGHGPAPALCAKSCTYMPTSTGPNPNRPVDGQPGRAVAKPLFSQELRSLARQFADRRVCLAELLAATQGRGYNLLLVCIALPFVTPIPLPGVSLPFGVVVTLIGARLAFGQKPWLPQRLLNKELPPRFLDKLLAAASRIVKVLEWLLRPRLVFVQETLVFRRLAGAMIALCGLFMLLPLPLPFSNGLPAGTVLLLAAAALERDGLCFLAGCALFALTTAYFCLLAFGGANAIQRIWQP